MAAGGRSPAGRLQGAARSPRGATGSTGTTRPRRSATTCTSRPRRTTCCCGGRASSCCCPTAACSPSTAPGATATAAPPRATGCELECLEPFRRWRGRYAGPVHRLAGEEIVAGPRQGSELARAVSRRRGRVGRPALEHRGRLGRAAAVAALPPVLRRARHRRPSAAPRTRSPGRVSAATRGAAATCPVSPATPSSTGAFPAVAASACCATGRPPTVPSAAAASSTSTAPLHDADVVTWPHLDQAVPGGERLTIELHAGRHRPSSAPRRSRARSSPPPPTGRTYGAHAGDEPGTVISPAFARYQWDGETGYGGLERSALRTAITIPAASRSRWSRSSASSCAHGLVL